MRKFRVNLFPHTKVTIIIAILCTFLDSILGQITMVPEVKVTEGTLRGTTLKSRDGRKFFAFQGIRYAEKPGRFELAKPAGSWEGVKQATETRQPCAHHLPQFIPMSSMMGLIGSEDCLFLNVYTAHMNEGKLWPVMVYIHGGAFIFGAGSDFGPDYFLDEDVILVTFNYRLGAFGLLYTDDNVVPGNLAMKDQVLALQWVQRNIHHFGGDKNQVTIFGESAGSVSVHLHILSPMSTGLFQKAIAQSGVGVNPWAITQHPRWMAQRLAGRVDCPVDGPTSVMMDCLKAVDAATLADAQSETSWGPVPDFHWAPVVECVSPNSNSSDYFLTRHPMELIMEKKIANPVPLIIGIMKNEGVAIFSGLILHEPDNIIELNNNWSFIAPLAFQYFHRLETSPRIDAISAKIRHFYFGKLDIDLSTEQRFTDAFSDRYFIHGIMRAAYAHAAYAPVYPYIFTFYDGFSTIRITGYEHYDPPTHGDDVPYMLPVIFKTTMSTKAELEFSKNFVKLWVSFVKTGKPEATWGSAKEWPVLGPNDTSITWYRLDRNTQLVSDPFHYRMKFWDQLMEHELKGLYRK